MTRPSVCLSMIVRNEAHVIGRCLDSVRPLIQSYVVHDTGSTDGTPALVRGALQGLPGTVRRVPWVDFAHNRNLALAEARHCGDAVLFMDADDRVELEGAPPRLGDADLYTATIHDGPLVHSRPLIVASALPARFVGAVHEYLDAAPRRARHLPSLVVRATREGARNKDPDKYRRDAALLERALTANPDDTRSLFYLAQSWRDAGDLDRALRHYRARAEHAQGWLDERWYSLYQIGRLMARQERPWREVAGAYLEAWRFLPSRAEPLYRIGTHHVAKGEWEAARLLLGHAMRIPRPGTARLFVEPHLYDVAIPFELSLACAHLRDFAGAADAAERLLASEGLPPEQQTEFTTIRDLNRAAAAAACDTAAV